MSKIPELAICRQKPTVTELAGCYIVVYQRDLELTTLLSETHRSIYAILENIAAEFPANEQIQEWRLPDDEETRTVEHYGRAVKYSKTRYGILKALILADGRPLTYEEVSQAGWGEPTDPEVIESTIYQFNRFLASNGVPKFIHCSKQRVYFARPDGSSQTP